MGRALIVDDEPDICNLLSGLLGRAGYVCSVAHSMKEGRAVLDDEPYDAVFLDIHLPDGSGYDLIPAIRAQSARSRCVVISAVDAERASAMAAGADAFLPKPFTRAQILTILGIDPKTNSPATA